MSEDDKLAYERLWKNRDLEIQLLWNRLTLLGAMMALTYTGYGVLVIKMFEESAMNWNSWNLVSIAACFFGAIFSSLWIATAKGSKRWYEIYEAAIEWFQNEHNFVVKYSDLNRPEIADLRAAEDSQLHSQVAGRFSVSRVPIVLGQVSLYGWFTLSFIHLLCLFLGDVVVKRLIDNFAMQIGALLILGCITLIVVVMDQIRSSFK